MSSLSSSSSSTTSIPTEKKSKLMKILCVTASIIAALGAINWGTISFGKNVAASVITNSKARKVFYAIVGIAGFIALICAIKWAMKKEKFGYGESETNPQLYAEYRPLSGGDSAQYSSLPDMYDAMA